MKLRNLCKKKGVHAAALLLAALAVTFICTTAFAADFTDVPQTHWAYRYIDEANKDGIIQGVGNNRFDPNGKVTLAEFTAMLVRMLYPAEAAESTASGEWWAKYEDVARKHEFVSKYINTDMKHALTREEMAYMIANSYPKAYLWNYYAPTSEYVNRCIPDHNETEWGAVITFCYLEGILQGVDGTGRFAPNANVTRAQAAVAYVRYKRALAGEPELTYRLPEQDTEPKDLRDLNEWGIPRFRMLDGENVQQMMNRINAVTPPYRRGYLTNGKPVTVENIQEMLASVEADMPETSPWDEDNLYNYNPKFGLNGGGCVSYAFAVSDYIFGEDAPVKAHKNFDVLKVGDIILVMNGSGYMHLVVTTEIGQREAQFYSNGELVWGQEDVVYEISGNSNDRVLKGSYSLSQALGRASYLDGMDSFGRYSSIFTRY